mgnify:FL=1
MRQITFFTLYLLLEVTLSHEEEEEKMNEDICRSSLKEIIYERVYYKHIVAQFDHIAGDFNELSKEFHAKSTRIDLRAVVRHLRGECRVTHLKFNQCFSSSFPELLQNSTEPKLYETVDQMMNLINNKSVKNKPVTLSFLDIQHNARLETTAHDISKPACFDNQNFGKFYAHVMRKRTDTSTKYLTMFVSDNYKTIRAQIFERQLEMWEHTDAGEQSNPCAQNYVIKDIKQRESTIYGTPQEATDPWFLHLMVKLPFFKSAI